METVPAVVIGGGIAGLAAAERLASRLGPAAVLVLERNPRLGGKILTEHVDGLVIESGPDCFLASKPAAMELCRQLGLAGRLRSTAPGFRRGFVRRNGRLHELPEGLTGLVPSRLGPLLTTRLLSLRGRLRAAFELFIPVRRDPEDESVAQFTRRRFGTEAYDWLLEPLLGGIFAGDGDRLSLAATLPQLRESELRHGGILRGSLRWSTTDSPDPTPAFVTLAGGLGELVGALGARLAGRTRTDADVPRVRREGDAWIVESRQGAAIRCQAVVIAAPAPEAARLLDGVDAQLPAWLRAIPFASTATISVALRRESVPRPLKGTGYLSPRAAAQAVVACTWTSNKFPERTPEGQVLLRFFVGRAGDDAAASAEDRELQALVRRELKAVHGIEDEPLVWRIHRWTAAMPQYLVGHRELVARIFERARRHPGLALAGCSYTGVGIPDCVASGWRAADAVLPPPAA